MGHIFISYSKKDVGYAEKLINALRREGFNPWFDVEGLGAGTHWQNRLQKQIYTCDAYILIMSRNSYRSRWVPDELVTAKTKDKPIFPLLLDDTELFLAIQTIQVEDVRGGNLPSEAFYQRFATVTPRQKKAGQRIDSVRLTEKARKQKADKAAEKASHYLTVFTNNVKDAIAVTSKISSTAYKSVAKSKIVKKISSGIKRKTKPSKKKR
jgi:hypothetical protein